MAASESPENLVKVSQQTGQDSQERGGQVGRGTAAAGRAERETIGLQSIGRKKDLLGGGRRAQAGNMLQVVKSVLCSS